MSVKIGSIIESTGGDTKPIDDGKSTGDSDTHSGIGDAGRPDSDPRESKSDSKPEPEVLRGFDSYQPADGGFEPIDVGTDIGTDQPRKRGRQKGWRKNQQATVPPSLADIDFASILVGGHSMLAAISGIEELELEKKEADKLTEALRNALKFHPAGISPEKLAYINLTFAIGEIYGSRAMAYRVRKMAEKAKQPKPAPPVPINRPAAQTAQSQATNASVMQQLWYEPASGDS